ncbi:hypothetical protein, partial [Pseudoduganella sp. GCM10020061]|uniref:hypothetical protein n=1 Tax=Pseudoduganella sp. GCM10020061 TaxID=3317345 RepID=UPI003636867C
RTWNEKTGKATYLTHRLAALSTIGVTLPDRKNSRSICRMAGGINIRGTSLQAGLTPRLTQRRRAAEKWSEK